MPVAGGQVLPEEIACGVVGSRRASQGARRAARPRRDPLWDDARGEGTGVHSPCGSTLRGAETPAGGQVLWAGVACGVGGEAVALQEARRTRRPRRATLWGNARKLKGDGRVVGGEASVDRSMVLKEAMVAAAMTRATVHFWARVLGNLATVLLIPPWWGVLL